MNTKVDIYTPLRLMLYLWLILDSISGYFLVQFSFSVSQPIRGLFTLYMIFLIPSISRGNIKIYSVTLVLLLTSLNLIHVIYNDLYDSQMAIVMIKVLTPLLMYIIALDAIDKKKLDRLFIKRSILINSIVLLLNIYLTYFNLGFSNYGISEDGAMLGGTGYFYAGNEVAGVLLALHALNLLINFDKKLTGTLSINILFIAAAIGLFSKSAIFGTLFTTVMFYVFRYGLPKTLLFVSPIVFTAIFALYQNFSNYISLAAARWTYLYSEYGTIFLFGGIKRWGAIQEFINQLRENPFILLSGQGWSGISENGFIDLMQAYGVTGIAVFVFWLLLAFTPLVTHWSSKRKNRKPLFFNTYALLLLLMTSFFAGHILQSAMIAPFLVYLYLFYKTLNEHPGHA